MPVQPPQQVSAQAPGPFGNNPFPGATTYYSGLAAGLAGFVPAMPASSQPLQAAKAPVFKQHAPHRTPGPAQPPVPTPASAAPASADSGTAPPVSPPDLAASAAASIPSAALPAPVATPASRPVPAQERGALDKEPLYSTLHRHPLGQPASAEEAAAACAGVGSAREAGEDVRQVDNASGSSQQAGAPGEAFVFGSAPAGQAQCGNKPLSPARLRKLLKRASKAPRLRAPVPHAQLQVVVKAAAAAAAQAAQGSAAPEFLPLDDEEDKEEAAPPPQPEPAAEAAVAACVRAGMEPGRKLRQRLAGLEAAAATAGRKRKRVLADDRSAFPFAFQLQSLACKCVGRTKGLQVHEGAWLQRGQSAGTGIPERLACVCPWRSLQPSTYVAFDTCVYMSEERLTVISCITAWRHLVPMLHVLVPHVRSCPRKYDLHLLAEARCPVHPRSSNCCCSCCCRVRACSPINTIRSSRMQ